MLWNTWKWFQQWIYEIHGSDFRYWFCEIHESDFILALWNTWKWFQQWFCEIHESDFSNGFVNRPVCEIHERDFNIGFLWNTWDFSNGVVKYMKVISSMVLWKTWKWFQYWFFMKYMKVISTWTSGLMKTSKGSHTCTVEIWFVNWSQRWWKSLKKFLYVCLRSDL